MQLEFWLERWQRNEIGFHQDAFNPHLQTFWPQLELAKGCVFVPLAGKSRDMLWLRAQGYEVLGVEISCLAVEAFFRENELQPEVSQSGCFTRYSVDGLTLLAGDFFELGKGDLANVIGVFDRASLVALPPLLREEYARHMGNILPPRADILLVTLDYPQLQMEGPPFSVAANEVARLYAGYYSVTELFSLDVLAENPRFSARGLSAMYERVFRLRRMV